MRALVTGASGFVGVHLVAHLRDQGDEVIAADRATGGFDVTDAPAVAAAVADARPEVVYHLAGWADVGGSWDHPTEVLRTNAEGTLHVLEACRSAGVSRVVVVTSADIYGPVAPEELPLTEVSPLRPVSPYAASKVAADYLALQAHLGRGQAVVRARAFNHLGPGQSPKFVAAALAHRIAVNEAAGRTEVAVGNLSARRDFTDVRDVVRAYRLLALHGTGGEAYNVCSGQAVAIEHLARSMVGLARSPMELVADPDLFRPVDVPELVGDAAKLRAATRWQPERDLQVTLADLLDDMRARVAASG